VPLVVLPLGKHGKEQTAVNVVNQGG